MPECTEPNCARYGLDHDGPHTYAGRDDDDDLGCPHCGERCDVCVDTLTELADLRRERDEARAEVERLRAALAWIADGPPAGAQGHAAAALTQMGGDDE